MEVHCDREIREKAQKIRIKEKVNHFKTASKIMKCPNCGTEIPDGFSFCGKCGTQLNASFNGFNGTQNQSEPDYDEHYYESLKNNIIAECDKYLNRVRKGLIGAVACGIAAHFLGDIGGFWPAFWCVILWIIVISLVITALVSKSYYENRKEKIQKLSAHDLYIEKKRNSQMWSDVMKGARVGLGILRIFGGL